MTHGFSHKRVTYEPAVYRVRGPERDATPAAGSEEGDTAWVAIGDLDDYALPVAQRKIAELAQEVVHDVSRTRSALCGDRGA